MCMAAYRGHPVTSALTRVPDQTGTWVEADSTGRTDAYTIVVGRGGLSLYRLAAP